MKKSTRKLSLNRTTLRILSGDALKSIRGGQDAASECGTCVNCPEPSVICHSAECPTDPPVEV